MKLADKSRLKYLDEHRRGRLDLAEEYDLTPWAALYAGVHAYGYPNNKIPKGKQSTFSYVFETPYDGLFLELADFKAYVAMHLIYTDIAGEEMAQQHRDEMRLTAQEIIRTLKAPVDHFGTLFDPTHCTFTE
ncbi:MAG: hypothetical protein IT462_12655 [Planctomycetes bacterium]|nr:hypothetical protein [Planctomycetota bacterium]